MTTSDPPRSIQEILDHVLTVPMTSLVSERCQLLHLAGIRFTYGRGEICERIATFADGS